jgi:hypothetical protein
MSRAVRFSEGEAELFFFYRYFLDAVGESVAGVAHCAGYGIAVQFFGRGSAGDDFFAVAVFAVE